MLGEQEQSQQTTGFGLPWQVSDEKSGQTDGFALQVDSSMRGT